MKTLSYLKLLVIDHRWKGARAYSMADFLALQLVPTTRSGAPLRLMGHFAWPTYFLDPRGPRAHIPCSHIRLSSPRFPLYICLPVSAWSSRLLRRAHSLST